MKTKTKNLVLSSDYYKHSHWLQIPKNTEIIYSYGESRGGKYESTLFFGLQAFIKEYLEGPVLEQWMIDEAEIFLKKGFGFDYFNKAGWQYILDTYKGHLPVKIRAVKEGCVVPVSNALFTIENTDPKVPWLTNFLETILLRGVWYPTTVATHSYHMKKMIQRCCEYTGCECSPFHLNDFGARGAACGESAGLGGAAHLVSWLGTDTIEGVLDAQKYYGADVCGFSVFASEHSTTTIYGKEHEINAYKAFFDNCPDEATLSIVIDSYNTEEAVKYLLGGILKDRILNRKGKTVFRPDSGDPVGMSLKVVQWLWDIFGGNLNEKGFKILNPHVGVIYGDSINYENCEAILENLQNHGFAAINIIFGSGGALLQGHTRDTQKFAVKCSAARIGGEWIDVFKSPFTDSGKWSKKGRHALVNYDGNNWTTVPENLAAEKDNKLELVFENGKLMREQSFDDIRKLSNI